MKPLKKESQKKDTTKYHDLFLHPKIRSFLLKLSKNKKYCTECSSDLFIVFLLEIMENENYTPNYNLLHNKVKQDIEVFCDNYSISLQTYREAYISTQKEKINRSYNKRKSAGENPTFTPDLTYKNIQQKRILPLSHDICCKFLEIVDKFGYGYEALKDEDTIKYSSNTVFSSLFFLIINEDFSCEEASFYFFDLINRIKDHINPMANVFYKENNFSDLIEAGKKKLETKKASHA